MHLNKIFEGIKSIEVDSFLTINQLESPEGESIQLKHKENYMENNIIETLKNIERVMFQNM